MRWIRVVAAVLVGYLVSQGVNGLLVYTVYVADAAYSTGIVVPVTVVVFILVGALAGVSTAKLAGPLSLSAVRILTVLIVLVTVGNIVADVAAEPLWHKLLVLMVMAPAVLFAGSRSAGTPFDAS